VLFNFHRRFSRAQLEHWHTRRNDCGIIKRGFLRLKKRFEIRKLMMTPGKEFAT
jgi:hypothetical protein